MDEARHWVSIVVSVFLVAVGGLLVVIWHMDNQIDEARLDIARLQEQTRDCK